MAWDVLSEVAKNGMGCFVRDDKNSMGYFVRGGKSLWEFLSWVSKMAWDDLSQDVLSGSQLYSLLHIFKCTSDTILSLEQII